MTNDGQAASLQPPASLGCSDVVCGAGSPGSGTLPRVNPSSQRSKILRMILNTHWKSRAELPRAEVPGNALHLQAL